MTECELFQGDRKSSCTTKQEFAYYNHRGHLSNYLLGWIFLYRVWFGPSAEDE
jgi:hypothetical protein